jgi:hypothetical protein
MYNITHFLSMSCSSCDMCAFSTFGVNALDGGLIGFNKTLRMFLGTLLSMRDHFQGAAASRICMCVNVYVCVYIYTYVCTCLLLGKLLFMRGHFQGVEGSRICVMYECVCVSESEGERERERERERESSWEWVIYSRPLPVCYTAYVCRLFAYTCMYMCTNKHLYFVFCACVYMCV